MNKKIVFASLLLIIMLILVNNNIYDVKREYEKLNGKKNYAKVKISKDNSFHNISSIELSKIVKETSILFVGSNNNQASRNSINILAEVADDTGIDKIYYIDINNINNKNIIKKYKISRATLLTFKNGKIKDIISNTNNKITKEELRKKYKDAINKILVCNPSGDTC